MESSLLDIEPAVTQRILEFPPFKLLLPERILMDDTRVVRIGSRALDILIALAQRPGALVSKAWLIQHVWSGVVVEEGTLRVHIAALRKLLKDGHSGRHYIENVMGRGYRFVAPVSRRNEEVCSIPDRPISSECVSKIPVPLMPLVGRSHEVAEVIAHLQAHHFVSIVGPGGSGKTVVAAAVVNTLRASYFERVVYVDLARLTDSSEVASAVAANIAGDDADEEDCLPYAIECPRMKRVLIVLDNCEHHIGAAARAAESLFYATHPVHVLATSREPLRAGGEWVQRIRSLALPPPSMKLTAAQALEHSAIQLFAERAAASHAGFKLTDDNCSDVMQLCGKLDGLPLAIEIAAANVPAFGVRALANESEQRLQSLSSGRRTAAPRHQALRATLDSSFEALSEIDQQVLRRLARLDGDFSAASAKAAAAGNRICQSDVLDSLARLAEKSLIVVDLTSGHASYRLFNTVKAYVLSKRISDVSVATNVARFPQSKSTRVSVHLARLQAR
jgi:predicted ATPase/DNA-binding winged helix-turn-helix (wHTH) protein